jgi:hypothetical protein
MKRIKILLNSLLKLASESEIAQSSKSSNFTCLILLSIYRSWFSLLSLKFTLTVEVSVDVGPEKFFDVVDGAVDHWKIWLIKYI